MQASWGAWGVALIASLPLLLASSAAAGPPPAAPLVLRVYSDYV